MDRRRFLKACACTSIPAVLGAGKGMALASAIVSQGASAESPASRGQALTVVSPPKSLIDGGAAPINPTTTIVSGVNASPDLIQPFGLGVDAAQINLALSAINAKRSQAGNALLVLNEHLTYVALNFGQELATTEVLTHTGLNGSSPGDRIKMGGYKPGDWGECVGMGVELAHEITQIFFDSPPHNTILMKPSLRYIGMARVGKIIAPPNPAQIYFWVFDLSEKPT